MDTVVKSDVFFFVTTIAVIVLTVVWTIAGYYAIKTMKNLRSVSRTIRIFPFFIKKLIKKMY